MAWGVRNLIPHRCTFAVKVRLQRRRGTVAGLAGDGSPRTVEAPFSAFLAAAVRDFARSSWFAGYSVQECVRACDDKRCSFVPHHGRWVFEAALFHIERLASFIQKRPLSYEELLCPPGGDAQPLVAFAARGHAECQVGGCLGLRGNQPVS